MNRPGSVASTRTSWTSLLILLVSCLPIPVLGDSPAFISLDPGAPVHVEELGDALELLEDRVGNLDVAAVSTAPVDARFVSATLESTNIGFSPSAWWARVTVRNPSDASRLIYLRQDYPLIDSLDLYEPSGDGGWRVHSTGDRKPFGSRDVAHKDFLFPVTLPANSDRTFYLRYASQGPVDINLSLLDPNEVAGELSREQVAYGLYFGCVLMLLVWSGLVFLAVRDGAFLAYFAYVATFGLYMTVNTGFAFQYLWPDSPRWANTALIVLLNIALITALQFSLTILRARDYTPRLFVVARVLQAMALVAITLIPVFSYAVLVRPVTFLILVSVCFMIALGVISLLLGSRPARFYVIAWGAFLCGSVVFLLKNFGLVPHTFVTQHSWQVGALLEMILLSMTLSSRMSELQHQSRTDPLTLLGNRRQFDINLPAEFARSMEQGQPLSLLVVDIDQFKLYNDLHGHAQGDEAVKAVAAALRKHARKPYIACRYGGDEFCAILPGTSEASAAVLAERLRAAVQHSLTGEETVTVSIGYACQTGGRFENADQLFEAADAALYSAKEQGRNTSVAFQGRRSNDPPSVKEDDALDVPRVG
ncbi:MAG TPA: diguanylate cyclase [Steroidobacteraceae bacterium]|nr:diguanylate cyclase [Steroidobacteraceae bacterium]